MRLSSKFVRLFSVHAAPGRSSLNHRLDCRIALFGVGSSASEIVKRVDVNGEEYESLLLVDDPRVHDDEHRLLTVPAGSEAEQTAHFEKELSNADGFGGMVEEMPMDMAVVVADLGENLANASAPLICRKLREDSGVLTLGVALLPFSFRGTVLNERARNALRRLKQSADAVFVMDSSTLNTEPLRTANFFGLHDEFLSKIAYNLDCLMKPLLRENDLQKITLTHFKEVFVRSKGVGQEVRLVTARSDDEPLGERGAACLEKCLTDELFPVNDVSLCSGAIVAVSGSRDMSLGEIAAVQDVQNLLAEKAILVHGLAYNEPSKEGAQREGMEVTLAVVGGSILSPEELAQEEQQARQEEEEEEERRKQEEALKQAEAQASKHSFPNNIPWQPYWKRFREWF